MFQPDLLKEKRVLITGGGSGLGKAMGRRLMELGAELMICGRRKHVLEETANDFEALFSRKVRTHPIDIRSAEAVEELMDSAFAGGAIDVLINMPRATSLPVPRRSRIARSTPSLTSCYMAQPIARSPRAGDGSDRAAAGSFSVLSLPTPGPDPPTWCRALWPRPAFWR